MSFYLVFFLSLKNTPDSSVQTNKPSHILQTKDLIKTGRVMLITTWLPIINTA